MRFKFDKIFFYLPFFFLIAVTLLFFNNSFLKGLLPFPGDLLLAEYNPWRQDSYFGFAPGAIPSKGQAFDVLRQLYPWRKLVIEAFQQGNWPLWNPYNFSGAPLLANFQSAAFYPLNLFYFVFNNFNLIWGFQVILQPFLASLFTFFLARRLKQSWTASSLSGLAFGFGSFMTVWLEYNTIGQTILWLPLALLALDFCSEKFNFFIASLFAFVLTFSLFAGHVQNFAFVFLACLAFFLFKFFTLKKRPWLLLPFFVLPFLFGAIQLLPGAELIFHSARNPLSKEFLLKEALLAPWQLIFAIVPDFFGNPATRNYFLGDTYIGKVLYIGLLPFILSLVTLFNLKKRSELFFAGLGSFFLLLSVSSPFSAFFFSLPVLSNLSPTQSLFLFQFSFALLAGFGLDKLLQAKFSLRNLTPLFFVGFFFLVAGLVWLVRPAFLSPVFLENLLVVKRNLGYSVLLFVFSAFLYLLLIKLRKGSLKQALLIVVLVFVIFDLYRFFNKITPFSPPEYVFPETSITTFLRQQGLDRFWGYGTARIESNHNALFGLYSPEGYDPLYPSLYGEFIRGSEDGRIKQAVRSDANIAPGFGRTDLADNLSRQKVLQALSVSLILDRVENGSDEITFPPDKFEPIWQKNGWQIYHYKQTAPRAFLASSVSFVDNWQNFGEEFFALDFDPQSQVVLGKSTDVFSLGQGGVEIVSYQPGEVKVAVEADEPGLLVLTDTFYPGWQATVNSEPASIMRANYALKAIEIPAGQSRAVFVFDPASFKWGKIISLISLSTWLIMAVFMVRFGKVKK